ncbi:hypothetical protein [Burkholderia ubonensis]|uniref:hypothetical protein n=1 Tax=Burkholderia ubonensis TaxID=101571 RepID=UPI0012FB9799|nr:hypothetical protein [Burkholderia ubonensis]
MSTEHSVLDSPPDSPAADALTVLMTPVSIGVRTPADCVNFTQDARHYTEFKNVSRKPPSAHH